MTGGRAKRGSAAAGLGALAVGLVVLGAWMLASRAATDPPARDPGRMPQGKLVEDVGVRVVRVAVVGGGGLIDLRYQVIDPEKAQAVHDEERRPAVMDAAAGVVAARPWMDHGHQGELRAGTIYAVLLVNPGGAIEPGDEVSVVLGGSVLEHVLVR